MKNWRGKIQKLVKYLKLKLKLCNMNIQNVASAHFVFVSILKYVSLVESNSNIVFKFCSWRLLIFKLLHRSDSSAYYVHVSRSIGTQECDDVFSRCDRCHLSSHSLL